MSDQRMEEKKKREEQVREEPERNEGEPEPTQVRRGDLGENPDEEEE